MGGEGSMSSANVTLKNNRSLLRKRNYRRAKGLILSETQKANVEFKKVNPDELNKIKIQIRTDAKKKARKNLILNIFLILIVTILGWLIIKVLDGN